MFSVAVTLNTTYHTVLAPQYGLSVLRKNTKSKYIEWRMLVGCIQSLQFDSGLWSQSWCSCSYWAQVGLPTNVKSIIWIGVFQNLRVTFLWVKTKLFFCMLLLLLSTCLPCTDRLKKSHHFVCSFVKVSLMMFYINPSNYPLTHCALSLYIVTVLSFIQAIQICISSCFLPPKV